MENALGRAILGPTQDEIRADRAKPHAFATWQALLLAIAFAATVTGSVYVAFHRAGRGPRESTLVALFILVFLGSLAVIDFPDRRMYRAVFLLGLLLVAFEIVGYEALRYLKSRNFSYYMRNALEQP